jgi:hypothetical protein
MAKGVHDQCVKTNLDALLTALYVHLDDHVLPSRQQPRRPGRPRLLSDAVRLMDGTPVPCGASRVTVNRSSLGEIAGYGRDASHHRFYWGAKLMLITTTDGTVTAFSLAHPKELDEPEQALHLPHVHPPSGGPAPIVGDKGLAGAGIEKATAELGHLLIHPARDDEPEPRANIFPAWPRQQIEAII